MDYSELFAKIPEEIARLPDKGKVANYIPELGTISPDKMGVHLVTLEQQHYSVGDSEEKFSIQSIAKVMALALAFELEGEKLWKRVGVEPSGNPFNSLVQLEYEQGIPRNPFINAGALLISDILLSHLANPKEDFLEYVRNVAGDNDIHYSSRIANSEKAFGFRNAALVNLMKSFGNIHHDVEQVLDFYFSLCSLELSCRQLAQLFLFLTAFGTHPISKVKVVSASKAKRIKAIMLLCGFYDEAGEFAFKVGLPGKSGVGGGIVAVHPGKYSIATWSPRLNVRGNSFKGMKLLEFVTTHTRSSIF